MWSKVEKYIKKHKLLNFNSLNIVALSGGADSVALLLLLHEAGYRVHAAHCNFRLRGAESDRDEAFCVDLCRRLGVELHRAHFDTHTYAKLHQVSIEMAARELRYRWFGQLCRDLGAEGVCVAHHRDDSVETVLLNLVRGTGLRGLTGMCPKTVRADASSWSEVEQGSIPAACSMQVVRPLLCVSRSEIEGFLQERGQAYVTDSTNLETDVQRNKIRLQVLPLLRELNPAVSETIQRMAENLSETQSLLDAVVERYKSSNILETSGLSECGSSEYIIFEWLQNYGFNGSQVRQMMAAETGAVMSSAKGFDVLKDRHRLIVEPSLKPMKMLVLPEEGTYVMEDESRFVVRRTAPFVSKDSDSATVDADKVAFPLTVRRVADGDWMVPYGMKGRKLLSDLMTDRKMTVFEKRRQLVVVDARGVVVWLPGLRVDGRVAVTDTTSEVLELTLVRGNRV